MFSLLCSFCSRFLKASFSSFCCLQQLALEPRSVASHSSSLSFSLLSVITKLLWKCKPLLGSELFFDEVLLIAGVSSIWWLVHGVGCIDWMCLVGVSSVWWAGVVGRFDWAHVFILPGVSAAFWACVVGSADGLWFVWWSAWGDVEARCVKDLFARWSGSALKEVLKGETIVTSVLVDDHLFVAWAFLASSRNFCLLCSSSFFCFFSLLLHLSITLCLIPCLFFLFLLICRVLGILSLLLDFWILSGFCCLLFALFSLL